MSDKDKALKQALEALLSVKNHGWDEDTHTGRALITALKAALEQPPLPVQRQPLSEKQVHKIWRSLPEGEGIEEFARAIEAAHNIGAKP